MIDYHHQTVLDDESIAQLDAKFIATLSVSQKEQLIHYRESGSISHDDLLALADCVEQFLIKHFGVEKAYESVVSSLAKHDICEQFYQHISKPAARALKIKPCEFDSESDVMVFAQHFTDEVLCIEALKERFSNEELMLWSQEVLVNQVMPFLNWQVFSFPKKVDYNALVNVKAYVPRHDYQYVGSTISEAEVISNTNYCIDCHFKDNDSCSKGLWDRKQEAYKVSPLKRVLMGCPLNQKISQMHVLRKQHKVISALVVTMIDNPLCVVTGDRICNDCMASCIYQKFEPVDTPSVESDTLAKVLALPYGAEIYLLLARWNPLVVTKHQSKGGSAAVVGMGPAGFAMSYYLLQHGASVVGFDGLPIRQDVGDVTHPIKDFYQYADSVLAKGPLGFGGVVEYGITARWDKRKILLVWVLLHRFPKFRLMGNMRLGGAVTIPILKQMGFDQVVLATGAGLPTAHPLQKYQGMWFANEFLMKLQISGLMYQTLQQGLALPIIVIGGGLTAIDCATEALVYYTKWVEQVAYWFSQVEQKELLADLSEKEAKLALLWKAQGEHIRKLRVNKQEREIVEYLKSLGGVTVVYRKSMQESPAYRINFIELQKALEQGVRYLEKTDMVSVDTKDGWVDEVLLETNGERYTSPAKTVFFATGSKPNVAYYYENRAELSLENGYYQRDGFYAKSDHYPNYVTIIGDLHPDYQGSVVGALASAKDSYQSVLKRLNQGAVSNQALSQLSISIIDTHQSSGHVVVTITTALDLPLGGYVKFLVQEEGVTSSISGVIVSQTEVWVKLSDSGSEALLSGNVVGVLGPSGTRVVSQKVSDTVWVVSDAESVAWALSIANAVKLQGKQVCLYSVGELGSNMELYFDQVVKTLPKVEGEDVFYCLSAEQLSNIELRVKNARFAYAVVNGPMMCYLKGICGQCIQWQVSPDGESLKAVYACSWPVQPLELIDVAHYETRNSNIALTGLYQQWKKTGRVKYAQERS